MAEKRDLPILPFESPAAMEAWLEANHSTSTGIWLKYAKKDSGIASVTYVEAVEVALCYGWIDGQSKSVDERYWVQRFTPRKPRGNWSQINTARVEALIAAGRMRPAGLREVEQAKSDGRWEQAYASPKNASVPEDLQKALDAKPKAKAFFETLNAANRYAILHRVMTAKKPETRARRIAQSVEMLLAKKKLHP